VPAAIANAISDALSPFGVRVTELPITAERVWAALRAARNEGGGPKPNGADAGSGGTATT
jgi:carbon-monoxide dehydrogenase large subunit